MERFIIVLGMYTERKHLFYRSKRLKGLKANTANTATAHFSRKSKSLVLSGLLIDVIPTIIT